MNQLFASDVNAFGVVMSVQLPSNKNIFPVPEYDHIEQVGLWDGDVSKLPMYQQLQALKVGFLIPETLYSNSICDINSKFSSSNFIYKAFDGGSLSEKSDRAIYTKLFEEEIESRHETAIAISPGIFQPYVNKKSELRITVIGNKVFPVRIYSQENKNTQHDWRKYDLENTPHEYCSIDTNTERMCVELLGLLNLNYGAIDIIESTEDEFVFLEINSNGQWLWLEMMTGAPIKKAIADWLS
jgi:glutathione synthase/RimK-type ligase-like ATP-grasp enzyme